MLSRPALIATAIALAAAAGSGAWYALGVPAIEGPAPQDGPLPLPPLPPRITAGLEYDRCLGLLADDPESAATLAEAWARRGDTTGAAHCLALSRVALGQPAAAAEELEALAAAEPSTLAPASRAALYLQAAQAWLMAANPARAHDAADRALALAPDDAAILVERAVAAERLDRHAEVVAGLTDALRLDPSRPDALVLRAVAHRRLGEETPAMADIQAALALDPDSPEALLERGILRQRLHDLQGARADWERVILLAPDTPVADLAHQNLFLLEAGPPSN